MKSKTTCFLLALSSSACLATTITTEFNRSEGFITGLPIPTSLSDSEGVDLVTFAGGQQQQSFFGAAYNQGPDAFIFNNAGFNGIIPTGDTGFIGFLGGGATEVSFHAASLLGDPTSFTAFGTDGSVLGSALTQVTSLRGNNPLEIISFSSVGGINIAGIEVNLPSLTGGGPAAATIDTFSADIAPAAVPEPSASAFIGLALASSLLRRRR